MLNRRYQRSKKCSLVAAPDQSHKLHRMRRTCRFASNTRVEKSWSSSRTYWRAKKTRSRLYEWFPRFFHQFQAQSIRKTSVWAANEISTFIFDTFDVIFPLTIPEFINFYKSPAKERFHDWMQWKQTKICQEQLSMQSVCLNFSPSGFFARFQVIHRQKTDKSHIVWDESVYEQKLSVRVVGC